MIQSMVILIYHYGVGCSSTLEGRELNKICLCLAMQSDETGI